MCFFDTLPNMGFRTQHGSDQPQNDVKKNHLQLGKEGPPHAPPARAAAYTPSVGGCRPLNPPLLFERQKMGMFFIMICAECSDLSAV